MVQTTIEATLGIPKFSGVKSVWCERTAAAGFFAQGKREWLCIRYTNGEATLPRGYKAVEDSNGYVITRELGS